MPTNTRLHPARAAIVTGASGGIGRAIALRLAADGFAVTVHYMGNQAKAEDTVAAIRAAGGEAVAVAGDVSQPEDVARLFERAQAAFGPIGVVVHSAGTMSMVPITPDGLGDFDRIIAANLRGTFLMLAQAARQLDTGARVIAMSTSVIARSFPGYGPYIAAKAGVEGLVKVLANEMRGRGITVNAVAPGPVGTALFLAGKSDEDIARLAKLPPLERLGEPEDIAGVVSFLAGPDGGWINGQVLRANGGFA